MEAVAREAAALRAAAIDLSRPVPGCPGWDVGELVRHVGMAHRNAALVVGERRTTHPRRAEVQPPEGVDPFEWLDAGLAQLLALDVDPATPVWTFGPDRTAAFWSRRMVHETLMHRVDAEQAAGLPSTIDLDLAADGVAEALEVFLPLLAPDFGAVGWDGEVLRLEDAAVRGRADDVLLWLWGRGPIDVLDVAGDADGPARLRRVIQA